MEAPERSGALLVDAQDHLVTSQRPRDAGDEWEQLLPRLITGLIVQEHGQAADGSDEAHRHALGRRST
jgi:hypothetical protein